MKDVLVQISRRYICVTACEQVLANNEKKEKKPGGDEKIAHTFSSPFIVNIEPDMLEGKEIWDKPDLIAKLVKEGITSLNHAEVKDVYIIMESFDLTYQEYQHVKSTKKVLDNLAVDRIRDFVGDEVTNFSVVYKDYSEAKSSKDDVADEVTAKAFGMPRQLINDLQEALKANGLNLIKIIPSEVAMIYAAQKTIYSFGKVVAVISMDYSAVRVVIARDGIPLYCHDFISPLDEILSIIESDKALGTTAALDYLRTTGYGFQDEFASPTSERRLEEVADNIIDDIVRNIRLVTMSLNIEIEQIFLSDFLAYIPHIRSYIVGFGLAKEVGLISDTFNNTTVVAEPSLKARDDFYKSGSFFFLNELMNSGTVYKDNLMLGASAQKVKTLNIGNQVAVAGSIVLLAGILVGLGGLGFFRLREKIDTKNLAKPEYTVAKDGIAETAKYEDYVENQSKDNEMLPKTNFYFDDLITEVDKQIVDKTIDNSFTNYSISHTVESDGGESYQLPISGTLENFNAYIDLQNNLRDNGFFDMSQAFSSSTASDSDKVTFSTNVKATKTAADIAAKNAKDKDDNNE